VDSQVLLGRSRVIRDLVEEALDVATGDSKVLITGEAGVGKELLARLIHERSGRCLQPMITINCGSVPEALLESQLFGHVLGSFPDAYCDRRGILEVADGGTVLLDEVGEMSLRMQMLLLRFLEDGREQVGGFNHLPAGPAGVMKRQFEDQLCRRRHAEFASRKRRHHMQVLFDRLKNGMRV